MTIPARYSGVCPGVGVGAGRVVTRTAIVASSTTVTTTATVYVPTTVTTTVTAPEETP